MRALTILLLLIFADALAVSGALCVLWANTPATADGMLRNLVLAPFVLWGAAYASHRATALALWAAKRYAIVAGPRPSPAPEAPQYPKYSPVLLVRSR
jgi:hypothetical protein